jgi:transposase-like protein
MEFMREYPDDATCLEALWRRRYSEDGEHAECPKCETMRVFKRYDTAQARQSWSCTACAHKLHPTAGTIFHKSSTSLHLWFYAMYLMTSTRCGISAKQLERELGVTYKTAWRMAHLIRTDLMEQSDEPLSGTVEVDETWVGGKLGNNAKYWKETSPFVNKTAVAGAVERGGRVVAVTVANVRKTTLIGNIQRRVLPASTIYSDELRSYTDLGKRGYAHSRVNHSERIYVSGEIHTNTIEGFWSLVKRGLGGVYHSVSAKHLQGYLNEYAWRYNHRKAQRAMFDLLLLRAVRS